MQCSNWWEEFTDKMLVYWDQTPPNYFFTQKIVISHEQQIWLHCGNWTTLDNWGATKSYACLTCKGSMTYRLFSMLHHPNLCCKSAILHQ